MLADSTPILVLNAGSSSIKFASFSRAGGSATDPPARQLSGSITGIGEPVAEIAIQRLGKPPNSRRIHLPDHASAIESLFACLNEQQGFACGAIGHRLVHGGPKHFAPERITPALLNELQGIEMFAPEHLPQAIALIRATINKWPALPQVACFDTAFHEHLPAVSRTLPLPAKYRDAGVRRYGFHGLSYQYLLGELARIGRPQESRGKVILAHLGHGASLAAVSGGIPVDTTMGMTPAGGLLMSSRTGDIDPGALLFVQRSGSLSPDQTDRLVNHESGMLGLSETSGDIRQLTRLAPTDPRARLAIDCFCYSATKWIGAFAAALGGLDTLVFSAGIGEHSADVRGKICQKLEFLGINLDAGRNESNAPIISRDQAKVIVRVIPTDEETTIVRAVRELLQKNEPSPTLKTRQNP